MEIKPGESLALADIAGLGAIQQIWMTLRGCWRLSILRIYWDGQEIPSVECPFGDFFRCQMVGIYSNLIFAGLCKSRQRLELLLGDAISKQVPDNDNEHGKRKDINLLPD